MRRVLQRLTLAALLAMAAGLDARAEDGRAPDPGGPPLGRGHLWVKFARADFQDDAVVVWGVDRATHVGLEGYWAGGRTYHVGGEIGYTSAGDLLTSDGDLIRDFGFFSLEGNNKWVFDLTHGFSAGVGLGAAVFWVEGDEVAYVDGEAWSSPLASFGVGVHLFGELTWRVNRFLVGVDAKYQSAGDWLYLDYSNVRFGVHLGVAF